MGHYFLDTQYVLNITQAYLGPAGIPDKLGIYWVPQYLPQIYSVIAYICIGKVA